MLILNRKCLVGAGRDRCGASGTPSTIIDTQWSSPRYKLWCDAPMVKTFCTEIKCQQLKFMGTQRMEINRYGTEARLLISNDEIKYTHVDMCI